MQQGADLPAAGYPSGWPMRAVFGGLTNVLYPNTPPRSNLEWFALNTAADSPALVNSAGSGTVGVVACPVDVGQMVSKVTVLIGGTAAVSPTHSFAALYGGTGSAPALLGQSTDATSTAIGASAAFSWTIPAPVTVNAVTCPYGFLYVGISVTAATLPSAIGVTAIPPVAGQYQWFANGALFFSANFGSAVAGTAPSSITSTTKVASAPIVVLT